MVTSNGLYLYPNDLGVIFKVTMLDERGFNLIPVLAGISGFFSTNNNQIYVSIDQKIFKDSIYWQDDPYVFIKHVFENKWKNK